MALGKTGQVVHRPGPLKQSNKPHKGGRSKDKKNDKGKQDVKTVTHHKKHELSRKERKNRVNQLRKAKRDEVVLQKRGLGGINNPPILSVILPIGDSATTEFLRNLCVCDDDIVYSSSVGVHNISFPRLKKRFAFCSPTKYNLYSVMDVLKVADVLILLHSSKEPDDFDDMLLSAIVSHSLPTTLHVIQGLDKLNPKKKAEYRKHVLKNIETRFPNEKLHQADTRQDFQQLLRQIGCQKQRSVGFRDARFHMAVEEIGFHATKADSNLGTLTLSGYIRGQPLNVNSLVHIPGIGEFQMHQLDYQNDPHPLIQISKAKTKDEDMSLDNVTLCDKANPSEQESLQSEVSPDPMEGEQTWPTKEELEAACIHSKKTVKKVAEGTSDYQAAWIIDSDENECSDDSGDDECDEAMSQQSDKMSDDMDQDMDDTESFAENKNEMYDKNFNMDEEKKMLVRFKEERKNEMFPDELDTPVDCLARVRFQRYRGLKNFANSPWDPLENLPPDYARIYRFENFKQTKKKVLTAEREGAMPGLYVTLHISNFDKTGLGTISESEPLVVFGPLPHEQKMSVLNVVIRKHPACHSSVKSKDTLIFHIGYRRFECQPIFSEHKTGNKFKYERFLPRDVAVVASFYAPVIFPPASVTVFKPRQDGSQELVATGSVLDVNPNRVVVKRIVLSGHPLKIFKRTAVVRYMFFNREDINWFKCVELRTKCGRRGHIREPIGSHGHMKCVFDKQLQSQDVVLMHLYKRVFPKWTYDLNVNRPIYRSMSMSDDDLFMT